MLSTSILNSYNSKEIENQFPNELLFKGPKLIMCNREKQDQQNLDSYIQMINTYKYHNPDRYPLAIDLESELKRINFYDDKCFYDNYKIDPNDVNPNKNALGYYKKAIEIDYSYYPRLNSRSYSTSYGAKNESDNIPNQVPVQLFLNNSHIMNTSLAAENNLSNYKMSNNLLTQNGIDPDITGGNIPDIDNKGPWSDRFNKSKQYTDGSLRNQLNIDWNKYPLTMKTCQEFKSFPKASAPSIKPSPISHYLKNNIVSPDYYNFHTDNKCKDEVPPERLFYNINNNLMIPNFLNYNTFIPQFGYPHL